LRRFTLDFVPVWERPEAILEVDDDEVAAQRVLTEAEVEAEEAAAAAAEEARRKAGDDGRGLHSFRFQLNLNSFVHRVTQLERVLELLKLSSNVNQCEPLDDGLGARAIDAMMGGTIETKRGGAYELKREAWMDMPKDKMTGDQVRASREWDGRVAAAALAKETHHKAGVYITRPYVRPCPYKTEKQTDNTLPATFAHFRRPPMGVCAREFR
jgi:hypothetical protein